MGISTSEKKKKRNRAESFQEPFSSIKMMQPIKTFPLFVLLALTADGASTKKELHRNAIDVFDENAFIDHLKTLFPSKEKVAAVEGKVTAVDSRVAAIEGLNLGDRLCQMGQTGCWTTSACGMTGFSDGSGSTKISYKKEVTFPRAFATTPSVEVAMHAAELYSPVEGGDWYGWDFKANRVTSTGFEFEAVMDDRKFGGIKGIWIACTI